MTTDKKIDMITMGLVNNFLFCLVDEMTQTMIRTAFSPLTRDIFDFQCGFCCRDGQVVIEGQGTLLHTLVFPPLIEQWLIKHRDTTYPGDVIITNDPYVGDEMGYPGASHLPDIYMLYPIFIGDELVAWSVAGGHQRDVGGAQPGSCATNSTSIYQEGLRIPFMKLYERGVRNDDLYRMIRNNCRLPDIIEGDIEAYRAACTTGERRFWEMVELWGWETVETSFYALLDYAERLTRAEIQAMPDGEYEFDDYLDDDGQGYLDAEGNEIAPLVKIHLKITVKDDTMTYDFTGTDPQVKGAMNNPIATSRALVAATMRFMMSLDIPRNDGALRPITLIIPKGTLLNPYLPGAVAARGATAARQQDTMLGAQAMIVPEKAMADASQVDMLFSLGGYDDEGNPFVVMEGGWGGWGGRPFDDGVEFNTPPHLNGANAPMETQEELYPLMYNEYAFVQDTGGAGKYRGSLGAVREYKLLCDEAVLQLRVDRQRMGPWGLCGGKPGAVTEAILNPATENRHINKINYHMKRNEVLRWTPAGAGGWGDPLDRDVNLVQNDVRNEKVSVGCAREVYGVIIDEKTMEVDLAKTQRLRKTMRKGGVD
jgi:N-methylhydantoinase B